MLTIGVVWPIARFISVSIYVRSACETYTNFVPTTLAVCALMALKAIPRARLVDTTLEDVTYDHDLIVVQTKKGSVSVKIAID